MTAQQLAFSLSEEKRGVHLLLWSNQGELIRALLVLSASLGETSLAGHLLSTNADAEVFRSEVSKRLSGEDSPIATTPLLLVFLQQASAKTIGPWLNGWRRPLSEPPGTLLIVRSADQLEFQKTAPDLASYVGPRIHDADAMLSMVSQELVSKMGAKLSPQLAAILAKLPGTPPTQEEIEQWVQSLTN